MSTITAASSISTPTISSRVESVPWLVWANVIASMCISTGLYWDISWHETIGRDSFWTPAHLLIQFGAVLGAFGSAWVIMRTTFGGDTQERSNSVNVLGFRAPLGAFISAWGGGAMLTSAPFDNWWHEAYGLDVKIISPPHMLLALGIAGIMWGGAILGASYLNRADGEQRMKLQRILMLMGGFIVIQTMTLKLEYTNRVLLHSAISYMVMGIGTLLLLEGLARRRRTSLGAHHHDGHLLGFCADSHVGAPALCRAAKAWAGVSKHHAHGAAAVSDFADRPGVLSRFAVAAIQRRSQVAVRRLRRRGLSGDSDRRRMAVCHVPYVFAGAEQVLLYHRFSILRAADFAHGEPRLCSLGTDTSRVLAQHGFGISILGGQYVDWDLLGQLVEEGETVRIAVIADIARDPRDRKSDYNQAISAGSSKFRGVKFAEEISSICLHFVFAAGRNRPRQQP